MILYFDQERAFSIDPYYHKNSESRKVPNRLEILLLISSFILNLLEYRLLRGFFLYAGIAQPSCHWKLFLIDMFLVENFLKELNLKPNRQKDATMELAGTNLSCPSVEDRLINMHIESSNPTWGDLIHSEFELIVIAFLTLHLPVTFVVQNEAFNWLKRIAHNGDIIDIRMYNLPVLPPELRPIVYRSGDKLSIVNIEIVPIEQRTFVTSLYSGQDRRFASMVESSGTAT
ncbi:hypothetical protein ACJX0J_037132 [Zea mays]